MSLDELLRALEVVQPYLHAARSAYVALMGCTPEGWYHLGEQIEQAAAVRAEVMAADAVPSRGDGSARELIAAE